MSNDCGLQPSLTFVLKLADRCNLACRYCYVFEFDKDAVSARAPYMTEPIFIAAISRIVAQLSAEGLQEGTISLHGGEPLLVGKRKFRAFLDTAAEIAGETALSFVVQTNAILLDDEWLDIFDQYNIQFAISLDGPPESHDEFRLTRKGQPTSLRVVEAVERIRRHSASRLFNGALCVINARSDGAKVFRYLRDLGLSDIDFLLPDGNYHLAPKFGMGSDADGVGRFLIDAFDAWFRDDDPNVRVRIFEQIIATMLGGANTLDIFGGIDGSVAFVETDGGILAHDVLRTCGPPFDRSDLNVVSHAFSALKDSVYFPWLELSPLCNQCSLLRVCRGGYPPHRFDGKSFSNPSFYCRQLKEVIGHLADAVATALPVGRELPPILSDIVSVRSAPGLYGELVSPIHDA
ncbi:radical SAM protein (plasmid) [Polymorphobacter sp. PAMC 29334]|uniref:radical SAM protein n=1 Tax=Polymorphobacter sp. PAMC 29334 TaxID=2862331 RepID=UPI001C67C1BA|nr:radical SAM protein [Polymorphobacter sp. PAMC 29334]QYE37009.1 radical SAM protein [Polymorphobacter sp. PAMC 29334]